MRNARTRPNVSRAHDGGVPASYIIQFLSCTASDTSNDFRLPSRTAYKSKEEVRLAIWYMWQRKLAKNGRLNKDRLEELATLPSWTLLTKPEDQKRHANRCAKAARSSMKKKERPKTIKRMVSARVRRRVLRKIKSNGR